MEIEELYVYLKNLEKRVIKLEKAAIKTLPNCPRCKGKGKKNIIKHGLRHCNKGIVQRYACKQCGNSFCNNPKDISYRMRNNEEDIRKALALHKKGYTLSQIAKTIGGISRTTALHWIKRFNLQVRQSKQNKPQSGNLAEIKNYKEHGKEQKEDKA